MISKYKYQPEKKTESTSTKYIFINGSLILKKSKALNKYTISVFALTIYLNDKGLLRI